MQDAGFNLCRPPCWERCFVPGVIQKLQPSLFVGTDWLRELHTRALLNFEHALVHTLQCDTFQPPLLSKIKKAAGTSLNKKTDERDQSSCKKWECSQRDSRPSLKLLYKEPEAEIGPCSCLLPCRWVSIHGIYSALKKSKGTEAKCVIWLI